MMKAISGRIAGLKSSAPLAALATEFGYLTASTVLLQLCNLAVSFVGARSIGLAHWGTWQLMSAVIDYTMIADLGIPSALNRLLPIFRGAGDNSARERTISSSATFLILSAALVSVFILAFGKLLFQDLSTSEVLAYGLYAICVRANQLLLLGFRTSNRFGLVSWNQFIQCPVLILLGIPWMKRFGLLGFLLAYCASIAVSTLATKSGWSIPRPSWDWREAWELIKEGIPIYLNGYIFVIFATLDRWFIAKFLGREAVGEFWLALVASAAVITIQNIISSQCYPRMANDWGRTKRAESVERWVGGQILIATTVSVALLVGAIICLPAICNRWLPQYRAGIQPALILMGGTCLLPLGTSYASYLLVTGRQWTYLKLQLAPLAAALVLWTLVALPSMRLTGAACITAITYGVYSGVLFVRSRAICRSDRVSVDRLTPGPEVCIAD
jgi:O-antigen/teichoic acid export membrane protein